MCSLEKAIVLAALAHEGQHDKAGAPYILHPLRVMQQMTSDEDRIVAVLHDLLEDSAWTAERLLDRGFSPTVVGAIESVTRRESESYEDFVLRAAQNPIGRRVKLADLRDNCDLSRIPDPSDADRARVKKYLRAISLIDGRELL